MPSILKNEEDGKLYFEIALGPKGRDIKKFSLNPGEGIAGWVAEHSQSLIVNDVETDSRFYGDISKSIDFPTYSILAVPMVVREKCVGLFEIINKKDKKYFTQFDLQWLEIFAVQAAIAIENAKYLEKRRGRQAVLRDSPRPQGTGHQEIQPQSG